MKLLISHLGEFLCYQQMCFNRLPLGGSRHKALILYTIKITLIISQRFPHCTVNVLGTKAVKKSVPVCQFVR